MKKLSTINFLKLKGNTRKEVIDMLGENYHPKSDKDILIYLVYKTWLNHRGRVLCIEFNKEGRADTIFLIKNHVFK